MAFNGSIGLLKMRDLILKAREKLVGRCGYRVIAEISLGQHIYWWKPKMKRQAGDVKKPINA